MGMAAALQQLLVQNQRQTDGSLPPPHPERVPRSNMEFLHQSTPLTKTNDVLRFDDNYAATDLAVITS